MADYRDDYDGDRANPPPPRRQIAADYRDRQRDYQRGRGQRGGQAQRGDRRRSTATNRRDSEKERNFRIKKGDAVVAQYEDVIKKKLFGGFAGIDDILKAKQYETNHKQVALPVSTRSVGFSTAETFQRVMALLPANAPQVTTVFQIYRVMLALIESKVFNNRLGANFEDYEYWYSTQPFEQFKTAITSLQMTTQRIGCLVRSCASFKYEEATIVPTFPAKKYTNLAGQRRYIPVAEIMYLTNLRETVQSLADPNIPEATRETFEDRNPIPGAIFGEDHLLQNPDQIIPAAYGPDQLLDDIYSVRNWIENVTSNTAVREKWFTNIPFSENEVGNESIFISNDSEGLHLDNTQVMGDIKTFWSPKNIEDRMSYIGVYNLAGEIASVNRYRYPMYSLRDTVSSVIRTRRSYKEACNTVER